jgi:hypothetical protein
MNPDFEIYIIILGEKINRLIEHSQSMKTCVLILIQKEPRKMKHDKTILIKNYN